MLHVQRHNDRMQDAYRARSCPSGGRPDCWRGSRSWRCSVARSRASTRSPRLTPSPASGAADCPARRRVSPVRPNSSWTPRTELRYRISLLLKIFSCCRKTVCLGLCWEGLQASCSAHVKLFQSHEHLQNEMFSISQAQKKTTETSVEPLTLGGGMSELIILSSSCLKEFATNGGWPVYIS